ncbi:MAG: M15 family metallopeptidase [Flavobacteriaceae bacterium]|nr:M15 family metallopeptidase [Flavobacteriaceae bacterium]
MKRNHFLKFIGVTVLFVLLLALKSFTFLQNKFTRNQLIGKGNPDIVGDSYTSKMHKEAKVAFLKMKTEAKKEGINIEVVSAYRSFQRQKEIFDRKYKKFTSQGLSPSEAIDKIIEYSTIPGTSRHHWGTDIDIIDSNAPRSKNVLNEENFYGDGPYCKLKEWLNVHSESFGFYEVYTNNSKRKGFKYEPWHFSYIPVSKPMLQEYKKLNLKAILEEENILGNEYFSEEFIQKYRTENILDINPELL